MAHEIAKLLLEHADTFLKRTEAIKSALALGMPLNEIEEYLDWVDLIRRQPNRPQQSEDPLSKKPPESQMGST
jgi:DNA-binding transcriptional MerR regulator